MLRSLWRKVQTCWFVYEWWMWRFRLWQRRFIDRLRREGIVK